MHVAGGALGVDRVDEADPELWRRMYELNVIATLNLTRRCLPPVRQISGQQSQAPVALAGLLPRSKQRVWRRH